MKYLRLSLLIAAPVVAAAIALAPAAQAKAASCSASLVGKVNTANAANSRFTVSGNTITATVKVTGDAGCTQDVTMAVWQAPNATDGKPYASQTLFNHVTETFGVGTHTISSTLPNCFFQADVVLGDSATGTNGSPVYPTNVMLGALHGGTTSCVVTPPVTPTTPSSTPTTPAPTTLVNTGPGDVLGLAAIVTVVAGIAYSVRQRLSLN